MTKEHSISTILLVGATVIIVWLLMRANGSPSITTPSAITVTGAAPVTYKLGDISIPGEVVNVGPTTWNLPAPPADSEYANGNCGCGCSGGVNINFASDQGVINLLAEQASDALKIGMANTVAALPYSTRVFISDATPTPWAQG